VAWLYPGRSPDDVAAAWTGLGSVLVVITDGADGAAAYREGGPPLRRPGRPAEVVDTIGAGDAFTAAMLSGLARRDLCAPDALAAVSDADVTDVLDEAVLVSSLTCERAGADPPRISPGAGLPLTARDLV
jgi:fructokinase